MALSRYGASCAPGMSWGSRKAVKTLLALTAKKGTKVERVVDEVGVVVVKLLHSTLAASTLTAQEQSISVEDVEQATSTYAEFKLMESAVKKLRKDEVPSYMLLLTKIVEELVRGRLPPTYQVTQGALVILVRNLSVATLMLARYLEHLAASSPTGYTGNLHGVFLAQIGMNIHRIRSFIPSKIRRSN